VNDEEPKAYGRSREGQSRAREGQDVGDNDGGDRGDGGPSFAVSGYGVVAAMPTGPGSSMPVRLRDGWLKTIGRSAMTAARGSSIAAVV
jgi:hypothetical protein